MVTHTRLTSTRYVNCLKQGCRQMQGMTGGPLFNTCVLRGSTTLVTAWAASSFSSTLGQIWKRPICKIHTTSLCGCHYKAQVVIFANSSGR